MKSYADSALRKQPEASVVPIRPQISTPLKTSSTSRYTILQKKEHIQKESKTHLITYQQLLNDLIIEDALLYLKICL